MPAHRVPRLRRAAAALRSRGWDVAAFVAVVALAVFYSRHLTSWLVNDDEGSYLYAAWRLALGERPYRDFLTPQLPAFLLPGGAVMAVAGPSVAAARGLAVAVTMLAGVVTWATARRLFGPAVAAIAVVVLLLMPDVFGVGRVYRPEPFMLAAQALAVAAFARGAVPRPGREDPPARGWLALSGALFGVATLAKLFGPWPLGGLLLWLAVDGRRRRRPAGAIARDALAALLPALAVTAAGLAAIGAYSGGLATIVEATIGHHLRQGASKPLGQVIGEGVALFGLFVRDDGRALLAAVALAVAWDAWRRPGREAGLFAWQLVSALAFFVLSRDRYPRHLVYLAPALAVLFALGVVRLWAGARRAADGGLRAALAVALAVGLIASWRLIDRDLIAARAEDGTVRLADVIDALTAPDDVVLSDYSELNFYARRRTTHAAASLSMGAVASGQITWRRIAADLARTGDRPALVALETESPYSHLSYLHGDDRAAFFAWLAEGYADIGGTQRAAQRYRLHLPRGREAPAVARFDGGPTLVAAAPDAATAAAGDGVTLRTVWRATAPIDDALSITVRLVDAAGNEPIAPVDVLLTASGGRATDAWAADEWTAQRVFVPLPPGTPPGDHRVVLGLYRRDAATGAPAPLAALGPDGRPLGEAAILGAPLRVTGWRSRSAAAAARRLGLAKAPAAAGGAAGVGDAGGANGDGGPALAGDAGGGLALVGAGGLPTATVPAGSVLPVTLAFRLGAAGPPPAIALAVEDPASGAVAADRRAALAEGAAAADGALWPEGLTVRRTFRLPIYANAAAGAYHVRASWPAGADGAATVDLGVVTIAARDVSGAVFELAELPQPLPLALDAALGDVARLIAAAAPATATAGAALPVTLAWRAIGPSTTPFKVTVQLLGPDGRPVAQHDAEPAAGARPTTGWLPDEIIVDRHDLALPPDLPPGAYTLAAALYHPLTAERLPRTGGAGEDVAPGLVRVGGVGVE